MAPDKLTMSALYEILRMTLTGQLQIRPAHVKKGALKIISFMTVLIFLLIPPGVSAEGEAGRETEKQQVFTVEDMLSKKGQWQAAFALSYINIHQDKLSFHQIPLQGGSYLLIPASQEKINEDFLSYGFTVRYGLRSDLEIFSLINFFSDYIRANTANESSSDEEHGFSLLGLGVSWEIAREDRHPALLANYTAQIINNERFENGFEENYFKTHSLTVASHYTADPLVFMLQAGYQMNLTREKDGETNEPGDIFSLSPKIYFAVNPYATLHWDLKWLRLSSDRQNGEIIAPLRTEVSYLLGAAYEINKDLTMFLDTEHKNVADVNQSVIKMTFNYRL